MSAVRTVMGSFRQTFILTPYLLLGLPSDIFILDFIIKILYAYLISITHNIYPANICPLQYLVMSINYELPHYVIISKRL